MSDSETIPLFVLPSGIFPSINEPLRVFEPRYKQMLDDCTLNEGPFGYIAHNPDSESIDGWSQPGTFGVMCSLSDMREQGTNLMFTANAERRFEVLDVVQAALPSMPLETFIRPLMISSSNTPRTSLKENSTFEQGFVSSMIWRVNCPQKIGPISFTIGHSILSM